MSSWIGSLGGAGRARAVRSPEFQQALQGIDQCRKGDWTGGIAHLAKAASSAERGAMPGIVFSFLGYGLALKEGRVDEGLALCRHAVRLQLFEPENHLNLARTQLLANDRSGAYRTVREGLRVDRNDKELQALRKTLGVRRRPALSFLPRTHPINRALGRLFHSIASIFSSEPEAPAPKREPRAVANKPGEPSGLPPRTPQAPRGPQGPRGPAAPKSPAASRGRAS
ncbi:MAG TPA: hypothetical protein VN851_29385 [Thermoanaerobaculia bacterium]|nr:hypothetical protein [Thermoanaerobaculia bacterium]